jgi:hypothetical protein
MILKNNFRSVGVSFRWAGCVFAPEPWRAGGAENAQRALRQDVGSRSSAERNEMLTERQNNANVRNSNASNR